MKRRRIRASIETQEVENAIDSVSRYLEISARQKDAERALHQMSRNLNGVQKSSDVALAKNRNVIHGISDPFMKEGKQRKRAMNYHELNTLRKVGIPGNVAIKKILSLGRWHGVNVSGFRDPRWRSSPIRGMGTGSLHLLIESRLSSGG